MPLVSADQLYGKTLYAKKNINVRKSPGLEAPILRVVKPGQMVGVVSGYHVDETGGVWWLIKEPNYQQSYVFHGKGFFDWESLKQQGVKTSEEEVKEEEQSKEEEESSGGDKIISLIQKIALIGFGALILVKLGQAAISKKKTPAPAVSECH